MLVQVPNKSTFLGPMQQDPLIIREKLFTGIDGDYNVTNMGVVVEVIGQLENFHITREELETTRLGKHINELRRKASDRLLASRAKSLIKKWKSLLPTTPGSGPPPGGGNNNNSNLATNGNTGGRVSHPSHPSQAVVSPRLGPHPGLQRAATRTPSTSPRLPPVSPRLGGAGGPRTPLVSPRLPSASPRTLAPIARGPGAPVRAVPVPSPALSKCGGGTGSRTSPVLISSSTSTSPSRSVSRPASPATVELESREPSPRPTQGTRSPSPEIILVSNHVSANRTPAKRQRQREESPEIEVIQAQPKRMKMTNGDRDLSGAREPRASPVEKSRSKRKPPPRTPRTDTADILNKQMERAKLAGRGKVRTTQELVQNLGIESRAASLSPPGSSLGLPPSDLVPKENQAELMNRFFLSQREAELPSRPSTAASELTASSELTSAEPSRAPSPTCDTVEDLLGQLPPIDAVSVLADWEAKEEEEDPELEGLIPVFKPKVEVTQQLIEDLNNGELHHVGGIMDHEGEFREWHEMTSLVSKDGEILHILPYCVID